MPPTKHLQARDEKRDELVAAARALFIADGFEATSVVKLADSVGVTANTIYWYFQDKDALLVGVLDAVLADALAAYQDVATQTLDAQLEWVLGQLQQMRRLVTTVHARIGRSPALNTWHDNFHAMAEGLLRAALEQTGATGESLDADVKIGIFTIESLLIHDLDKRQQRAICQRLASSWAPS